MDKDPQVTLLCGNPRGGHPQGALGFTGLGPMLLAQGSGRFRDLGYGRYRPRPSVQASGGGRFEETLPLLLGALVRGRGAQRLDTRKGVPEVQSPPRLALEFDVGHAGVPLVQSVG